LTTVPAFTALYVVAGLLGRATAVDDRSLSLVWPATGVAVLWFLTLTQRSALAVSAVLLVAATVVVNLVTRSVSELVVVIILANLVQVAAVLGLVRRWCPELGRRGGRPPLETPVGLMWFLGAAALGCLIGVLIGVVGLWALGASLSPISGLAWWGRNVWGVLALGTTGLLLIHRLTRPSASRRTADGGWSEAATMVATTVGLVALDYASGLHFAFLLPATTVWAGMRFSPLVVSAHALLGGIGVIWLTLSGHGLFAGSGSESTDVLLAQLFVGMTIMIGLFLAAIRQVGTRLQTQLREQQRDMATFARRAAHDLQNPLMLIEGWAGLLSTQLNTSSNGDRKSAIELEMVNRIQAATGQMRGLVSDLLADATARDQVMASRRVDLTQLAHDIAEARGIQEWVCVAAIPPVLGDESMLRRLLDNLVGNSVKYVVPGEPPHIEVTATEGHDGMVAVRVADRGIGIPAGSHQAVFEEFNRAHGDAYPGTGLGLSICRRIVERHGGDITAAQRDPGPGTVIELRLPPWQTDSTHPNEVRPPALVSSERAGN
jgi:signal transduction histidine kinase